MSFEAIVIRDRAGLEQAMPQWRKLLEEQPAGQDFFSDPSLVEFELAHGAARPYIVVVRCNGDLQCVAPFRIQDARFRLQFSVFKLASPASRIMSLFGSDFVWATGANPDACCDCVFEAVQEAPFDLVFFNALDMQSPLWRYCTVKNGKPRRLHFVQPSRTEDNLYRLDRAPTFEAYTATLGSSTRSSLKRRIKKLASEQSAGLAKVTSADQVRPFLDDVETIYRGSWQSRTYGHATRNSDAEVARLEHIARQGWLRSYLLTGPSGPMAFQVGYQYGNTFYACDFAFAHQWASYGPGAALMYLMLEDLYRDQPPQVIDLRAGNSPQKETFRGVPHRVGDIYAAHRHRWRCLVELQRGLSEVEGVARGVLTRLRLDKAVRRVLKHKR